MRLAGRGPGQRSLPEEGDGDRRQKAKAANDTPEGEGGDDMFTRAGVAAQ